MIAADTSVNGLLSLSTIEVDAAAKQLREIRRILTKRRVSRKDCFCNCADCQLAAKAPFQCGDCGYRGKPKTLNCDCKAHLASGIAFLEVALAQKEWPASWQTRPDDARADLKEMHRLTPLVGTCKGNGKGQPDHNAMLLYFEDRCSHSSFACPACGGFGDGEAADTELLMAMLREVNEVVSNVKAPHRRGIV